MRFLGSLSESCIIWLRETNVKEFVETKSEWGYSKLSTVTDTEMTCMKRSEAMDSSLC